MRVTFLSSYHRDRLRAWQWGGLFLLVTGPVAVAAPTHTWQAAIDLVTRQNAAISSAQNSLRSAESSQSGAWSTFFPQLSANMGVTAQGDDLETSDPVYSANLSASQNLFRGWRDWGSNTYAQAQVDIARTSLQIAKAQASYDLKASYEGVLYATAYVKLADEIIQRRKNNLDLVQLRFENGRENKGSVLLSLAYLEQARYDKLLATNALSAAQGGLAKVMGIDEFENIHVEEEIPVTSPPEVAPSFTGVALSTPEYIQAAARVSAAGAQVQQARASFFPSLDLTGSLGRRGTSFFPDQNHWSVGIGVSFPLFSGLKDYHSVRSANANEASVQDDQLSSSRQIALQLREAHDRYVQSVQKLRVDSSFREAAHLRSEVARKKYNDGLLTFEDWDVIETDLINRQKSYLQSKRDRVTNEAAWEQAQGKGVIP